MKVILRRTNQGQVTPSTTKLTAIEVQGVKSQKQAQQVVDYLYGKEATGIVPSFKQKVK